MDNFTVIPYTDFKGAIVKAQEGFAFSSDRLESVEKPVLKGRSNIDSEHFCELESLEALQYAVSSAIIYITSKKLEALEDEDKKKDKPGRVREVDEAIKRFRQEYEGDSRYFTKATVMQPATRYYVGKSNMQYFENVALLDKMSADDLQSLRDTAITKKDNLYASARATEGWTKERIDYTPEGWRTIQNIKYNKLYSLGKISDDELDKKLDWVARFRYKPGWNIPSENRQMALDIEQLNPEAQTVWTGIQCGIITNAINKDRLLVSLD